MAIRFAGLSALLLLIAGCPALPPGAAIPGPGVLLVPVTPAGQPAANRIIVATSPDQTLGLGTSVNLAAVVTGGAPPYSFTWQLVSGPDQRLSGELSPVATVSGLNLGKSEFRVTVADFAGAVAVGDVNVTVVPVPLPLAGQAVPRVGL